MRPSGTLSAKTALVVLALLPVFCLAATRRAGAQTCTHYASPGGTGSGLSAAAPFKIANFWSVARPGATLCLLDGQYTGAASMIIPPKYLSGTASARITVRALNDGKATIHGQGTRTPVRLLYNNYFVLQGFNARNSATSVLSVTQSHNNIVRRVAAWDARDGNYSVFSITSSSHNLLEDVAGWGIGRKIFSSSQGGNYTTIRRAWGRWEGSHVVGPKMTYTLAYNNYYMVCENCIGTWSGERMKESYTLLDYYGNPWTGSGGGTYTNYSVNQPYGVFAVDGFSEGKDRNARSKILGSLAYVRASDRFQPNQAVLVTKLDSFELANTAVYIQAGYHASKRRFALYNLATAVGTNLVARHLTGVGGAASYFGSDWEKSYIREGATLAAVGNVFTTTSGANLCYRYRNAALTSEPLWPWPMNQRIKDALAQAGRAPVDVTATIQSMFGTIPSHCKSAAVASLSSEPALSSLSQPASEVPSAPANLVVAP
ncbi:MAG TPA: hypothetical protein VNL14_10545 [Candidatus Acidoferrales bacterium]|nr:hypothetical protein [Candidatus Acidoferrales bacterium]